MPDCGQGYIDVFKLLDLRVATRNCGTVIRTGSCHRSFLVLMFFDSNSRPFHLSFHFSSWRDDWSHSLHRRSDIWGFPEFSIAVRYMTGDLCTAPSIISLLPYHPLTDVTDLTLGASGLWLGTRTRAGGTAILAWSFLTVAHGSMNNRPVLMISLFGTEAYIQIKKKHSHVLKQNLREQWVRFIFCTFLKN